MAKDNKNQKQKKEENRQWHTLSSKKVGENLNVDFEKGLQKEKAILKREKAGENKLPEKKALSSFKIFLKQFKSPLIYILVIAGIISLVLGKWPDAIIIFVVVIINTIVGYFQEKKASQALQKLRQVLKVKATVIRDDRQKQILQEKVVPGDIVILKPGNKVPADGRIIETRNLKINEAPLTGEWAPVTKKTPPIEKDTALADRNNMVYMGTTIEDGEGKAVITETGMKTQLGKIAQMVKKTKEEKTPYQKKLAHFSKIIGIILVSICVAIFVAGTITGKAWVDMFVTSVAVAVAGIPEALPIAMTAILALGMQRILKRNGLVRKLSSAETLGSTSVISTDKTLTLTQGKMRKEKIVSENPKLAIRTATICAEGFIENPEEPREEWKVRGSPTDRAMVLMGEEAGFPKRKLMERFPIIQKLPFNTKNKYIASLNQSEEENTLFVSGAPERIMELSRSCEEKTGPQPLDNQKRREIRKTLEELTQNGLRVVAVGYKKSVSQEVLQNRSLPQNIGLTFVGLIGLKDPLRKDAKKAIRICGKAGMRPIMVTGDYILTARAIARDLGMKQKPQNVMEGKELDRISDKELTKRLPRIHIFARAEPKHKMRIIRAWKNRNKVVAMTGDGVNDAPALKKADIGVALGSGTDVAKQVSDLVLLNDKFSIIVKAVEEGRAILDNIRKVVTYFLANSFAEVILIGVSVIAGAPLPVTAPQILWTNVIEDGLPGISFFFEPKEKGLMKRKPAPPSTPLLTKEMKVIMIAVGIAGPAVLMGIFFWLLAHGFSIDYIHTIMLIGLAIDALVYIFACKNLKKNLWNINPFSNKILLLAVGVGALFLVAAVYVPFLQPLLDTIAISWEGWTVMAGFAIFKLGVIEGVKYHFITKWRKNAEH